MTDSWKLSCFCRCHLSRNNRYTSLSWNLKIFIKCSPLPNSWERSTNLNLKRKCLFGHTTFVNECFKLSKLFNMVNSWQCKSNFNSCGRKEATINPGIINHCRYSYINTNDIAGMHEPLLLAMYSYVFFSLLLVHNYVFKFFVPGQSM